MTYAQMELKPKPLAMPSKGFSLVELLIALGIFSVIALSLYVVFANGLRIQKEAKNLEDVYRDARFIMESITQDVENMVPLSSGQNGQEIMQTILREATSRNVNIIAGSFSMGSSSIKQSFFKGDEKSVNMAVPFNGELREVRYELKPSSELKVFKTLVGETYKANQNITVRSEENFETESFIREVRPIKEGKEEETDDFTEEVLSPYILKDQVKFQYAARDGKEASMPYTWKDSWEEDYFPAGIRVEMSFFNPNNEKMPIILRKDIFIPLGSWGGARYRL